MKKIAVSNSNSLKRYLTFWVASWKLCYQGRCVFLSINYSLLSFSLFLFLFLQGSVKQEKKILCNLIAQNLNQAYYWEKRDLRWLIDLDWLSVVAKIVVNHACKNQEIIIKIINDWYIVRSDGHMGKDNVPNNSDR